MKKILRKQFHHEAKKDQQKSMKSSKKVQSETELFITAVYHDHYNQLSHKY